MATERIDGEIDWTAKQAEARAFHDKRWRERKHKDPVDAVCHEASINATDWAKEDGLHPRSFDDDGRPVYDVQQGLRAAHVGREDAAATLLLMRPTLYGLRAIARLLWVVIALLAIILWRVW